MYWGETSINDSDEIPESLAQHCRPEADSLRIRLKPSLLWRAVGDEFRLA